MDGLDDHARARVGTMINQKYRLDRLIGSGGMASVYLAAHRNGHRAAIKMLHPHLSIDAELRARFLREGYVANKVEHRGAVRVLDDDTTEDGSVFLVMELLEGETLDARFERSSRKLPVAEVCELAHELLDVLAAAHAKGVVHRDIKPENLFLTLDGVLKVLDFGIARLREAGGPQGATQTGRMMGTPAFMPPEQALGRSKQIDGQTDLWAVGATMFTLLSGQYVHEAETMEEMLIRSGSQPARSVVTAAPETPPAIAAVVDRALVFNKEQRWADARAMEAALGDAYRLTYGVQIPTTRPSARPSFVEAAAPGHAVQATASPTPRGRFPASMTQTAPPLQPPLGRGVSTTAGVTAGQRGTAADAPAGLPRSRSRAALWATLGAVAVAALGAANLIARSGRGQSAATSATAEAPRMEVPPTAQTSSPEPTAAPSAQPAASTPPSTATAAAPPPTTVVTAAHARRPTAAAAPSSVTAAVRQAGPASASPVPSPAKTNCDVPFYIDSQGIQRIRPECQ